jgi:hypothetical protein
MINKYKGILFTLFYIVNYEKCKLIEEEIMHVFFIKMKDVSFATYGTPRL